MKKVLKDNEERAHSATLNTGNNVERIWQLKPAACTSCPKLLLQPLQMAKYFVSNAILCDGTLLLLQYLLQYV